MKLFLKILKWLAIGVVTVLVLGFLYLYFIYFGRPADAVNLAEIKDKNWHTIPFKGNTRCSDGSEFAIYARKGTSKNLIIHFSGGGACWDDSTCARPLSLMSLFEDDSDGLKSFYMPTLLRFFPKALNGMADAENPANAFRDWNVIFIPYCTGDLHVGNVTNTYTFNGKKIEIHHNGRNNSLAALEWIFTNFKTTDKIMVSGESAGAYGSAFWTPYIADHYAGQKIYQLSDGSLLTSERWKEILDGVWKGESTDFLGFRIGKDIYEDALIHRSDSVKRNIKHLHSNTVYDEVLTKFSAALNHTPMKTTAYIDGWSDSTRASMKRLSQSGIDYNYFATDWGYDKKKHGTPHTMVNNGLYNQAAADQVLYAEWLKKNVIDDVKLSLGGQLLKK